MNRKHFLSFLVTAGVSASTLRVWSNSKGINSMLTGELVKSKIPPYLKPGDTIGITSPASAISLLDIQPSIQVIQSWGFNVEIGKTIGAKDFSLGGTDEERSADFQRMLDDSNIKAIMCARGGYGVVRIIDKLNFDKFKTNPKWIIGFSDVTVLHAHINSNYNIATIHSKMCNSFPSEWALAKPMQIETLLSIRQVLTGQDVKYSAPPVNYNRPGRAEGVLVGGNLSIIEVLAGSNSDLKTENTILFLEDTHEELYRIDRMFWNLKRSGKLDNLKGLIIGGFSLEEETPGEEFGKTVYEIVAEKIKEYDYPVCFDFPVGHQINNFALKCGAKHILNVDNNGSSLVSI